MVIGEGGSGGALALAVANRVLMLENAVYSILSPEGFASILWKDAGRSGEAAELMKLTAADLLAAGGGGRGDPRAGGRAPTVTPRRCLRAVDRSPVRGTWPGWSKRAAVPPAGMKNSAEWGAASGRRTMNGLRFWALAAACPTIS